jgi:uncharacterized membrane protein
MLGALFCGSVLAAFLRAVSFSSGEHSNLAASFTLSCAAALAIFIAPFGLRKFKIPPGPLTKYSDLWFFSPSVLLFFWPAADTRLSPLIPLGTVLGTQLLLGILLSTAPENPSRNTFRWIPLVLAVYFSVFAWINLGRFHSLRLFDPQDWADFNQSFWNASRGNFFLSSYYGSHFVCHNTWFFYLLLPFYGLFPHPVSLMLLKCFFLALSAVPFYRIAQKTFGRIPPVTVILYFLFYPGIVAQNINGPQEMTYVPFALLWTYSFYQTGRFRLFVISLLLTLSIKESLAMTAIAFGIYAFFCRRSPKWIVTPVVAGLLWALFSFLFMGYLRKQFPEIHPGAAWFLDNLRNRFAAHCDGLAACLGQGLSTSLLSRADSVFLVLKFFLPLALLPLVSGVPLLATPDILYLLLGDRPSLFSPVWHYTTAFSCFVLIGSLEGIRKISASRLPETLGLRPGQMRGVLSACLLSMVLVHSYLWLDEIAGAPGQSTDYANAAREAVSKIPPKAPVTVPWRISPLISNREKFSFLEDAELEDFVVTDGSRSVSGVEAKLAAQYRVLFQKNGILLYQKKSLPPASQSRKG